LIDDRACWTYAPLTALETFERLRSFLLFCEQAKWLIENPVAAMKAPEYFIRGDEDVNHGPPVAAAA
jgi:hypothetical protein